MRAAHAVRCQSVNSASFGFKRLDKRRKMMRKNLRPSCPEVCKHPEPQSLIKIVDRTSTGTYPPANDPLRHARMASAPEQQSRLQVEHRTDNHARPIQCRKVVVGLNIQNAGANAANALLVRFRKVHGQHKLLSLAITCCKPGFYVRLARVRSLHELALLSRVISANCAKIR